MSRSMLVTVGTSMFHSASWRHEGPLEKVENYDRWLQPAYLESPKAREKDEATAAALRALLLGPRAPKPEDLPFALPGEEGGLAADPVRALFRYSAELTTVLLLARSSGRGLPTFLESYKDIVLAVDPEGRSRETADEQETYSAAEHLRAQLADLAAGLDSRVRLESIRGLSAREPASITQALRGLRSAASRLWTSSTRLDLVVSGGFKLYGLCLVPIVNQPEGDEDGIRLHYVHETADQLVSIDGNSIDVGAARIPAHDPELSFGSR